MRRDARRTLLVHTSVRAHANGTRKRTCRMTKTRRRVGARAFRVNGRRGMARTEPHERVRGRARGRLTHKHARVSALGSIEGFRVTPKRDSPRAMEPRSFASVTHLHISQVSHRALAEVVGDCAGLVEGEQDRLLHVVCHRRPLDLARLRQRNHSPTRLASLFGSELSSDRGQARRSIHRAKMQVSKLRDQKSVTASAVRPTIDESRSCNSGRRYLSSRRTTARGAAHRRVARSRHRYAHGFPTSADTARGAASHREGARERAIAPAVPRPRRAGLGGTAARRTPTG